MKLFSKNQDVISDAKQAAVIVQDGISKGTFDDMNAQLETLTAESEKERFVFPCEGNDLSVIRIVLLSLTLLFFIATSLLGIFMLNYSVKFADYGLIGAIASSIILALNIVLIVNSARAIGFSKRYEKYVDAIRFHSVVLIDDVISFSGIAGHVVIKDLKQAIKKKYIPQGHFGSNNVILIASEDAYATYLSKQAVYDRYYKKQAEERMRMKERPQDIADIISRGQTYVSKIHASNDIIKDKAISRKLDRMESIVANIFHEVDINPKQAKKLGLLLEYYLPTTEKLLNAYIDLDEKDITAKSIESAKKNIERSLDTINSAFEAILERFYQEQEVDVSSDISAMEIIMKQEGLN